MAMTPVSKLYLTSICVALAVLSGAARAGDAPVQTQWGLVSEPAMPTHICATLNAALSADHGSIDAVDANGKTTHPDQERLQAAIDACHDGAVKLVAGANGEDAFLTSPIQLKSGVILWIDDGVTLYASRDPKDYDNGPGDCGTANRASKKSCTSLIWTQNADHAGIVGGRTRRLASAQRTQCGQAFVVGCGVADQTGPDPAQFPPAADRWRQGLHPAWRHL